MTIEKRPFRPAAHTSCRPFRCVLPPVVSGTEPGAPVISVAAAARPRPVSADRVEGPSGLYSRCGGGRPPYSNCSDPGGPFAPHHS